MARHAAPYRSRQADESRQLILSELIGSVKGYSVDDESRVAEVQEYVEALTTTIRNYALTVSEKKAVFGLIHGFFVLLLPIGSNRQLPTRGSKATLLKCTRHHLHYTACNVG